MKASGNFDVTTFRYQFQVPSEASPFTSVASTCCPSPAPLALVQRGADPGEQLLAGPVAAVRHRDVGRPIAADHALGGPQGADARHDEGLVALGVGIRPGAAERRDRAVDEPRVALDQLVVSEPQSLHDAGAEGFDQHVGAVRHGAGDLEVVRSVQVEHHRLLAAADQAGTSAAHASRSRPAARSAPPRPRSPPASGSPAHRRGCSTGRGRAVRPVGPRLLRWVSDRQASGTYPQVRAVCAKRTHIECSPILSILNRSTARPARRP